MTKRKIYFRADAGANIGYGHFIRTLALADMLKDDFDCTFFTQSPTPYQISEMDKVCAYVPLQPSNKLEDFLNHLSGDEIVVLDNYFYTTEYQRQIKAKGCKLVCIDDMHDKHYVADVVINHGIKDEALFSCESYTKLCLGLEYALLRKPFLLGSNVAKVDGHWFMSFGGTDYENMTSKFMKYLEASPLVNSVTVVVGDAYKYLDSLKFYSKTEIKKNLNATQMLYEMSRAKFAVLPSSSVCIEAFACDCKIASGYFVDNQREFAEVIASNGYVFSLGKLQSWEGSSFIDDIKDFKSTIHCDFSEIPSRYINLFKYL